MSSAAERAALRAQAWPFAQAAEASERLARAAGLELAQPTFEARPLDASLIDDERARRVWLEATAAAFGIEALAVRERYARVAELLRRASPALIGVTLDGEPLLVLLLAAGRHHVRLLAPNAATCRLPLRVLRDALVAPLEAPLRSELALELDAVQLSGARRERAERALLEERLGQTHIEGCWLLRCDRARSLAAGSRLSVRGLIALVTVAYAAQYALLAFAWDCVANGALLGRVDHAWLVAWLLALVSAIPLQGVSSWFSARITLDVGAKLRERLLAGIAALAPDAVRREGTGQLLGRVLEAGTLESLGLNGGFTALFSLIDLGFASALLLSLPRSLPLVAALACAALALVLCARSYARERSRWTELRLELTHELIENMAGHRTRIVQQAPARFHHSEDQNLARYLEQSRAFDARAAALALLPRVWLLVACALIVVSLVAHAPSRVELALAFGAALVAFRAFTNLVFGIAQLSGAAIAHRKLEPLLRNPNPLTQGVLGVSPSAGGPTAATLETRALTLRVPGRSEPLVSGVDLTIAPGERILLEGASGSGKSSLAQALAGFSRAASGLVLLNGLDLPTLGVAAWRKRVTLAPQFHQNHVLCASFAFNLLLGRAWPPTQADLDEAEAVCRELGLGPLLDEMPSGILQPIGETGWQLSHGERSRLFAARAILTNADLLVLDESTAALDPATAEVVLNAARRHAPSLLLIAHP